MSELNGIADRLAAIVEELDEVAFDRLRLAAADGQRSRPHDDRELTKARRAVEKAVAVLRGIDGSVDDGSVDDGSVGDG
jgi:hypothetical protein